MGWHVPKLGGLFSDLAAFLDLTQRSNPPPTAFLFYFLFPNLNSHVMCHVYSAVCPLRCFFLVALSSFLFFSIFIFLPRSFSSYIGLRVRRRMASLELAPFLLHTPSASAPTQANNLVFIRQLQLGFHFPCLLKRAAKNGNLCLTRSFSGDPERGVGPAASQDGPFPYEEEEQQGHPNPHPPKEERGLVLAREMDDFGFLVGFRLIPESGAFFLSFPFCFFLFFYYHSPCFQLMLPCPLLASQNS